MEDENNLWGTLEKSLILYEKGIALTVSIYDTGLQFSFWRTSLVPYTFFLEKEKINYDFPLSPTLEVDTEALCIYIYLIDPISVIQGYSRPNDSSTVIYDYDSTGKIYGLELLWIP